MYQMSRTMTCLHTHISMLMMLQWGDEEQWLAQLNHILKSLKLLSDLADKNRWSYDLWRVYIVAGLAALRHRFFIYYVYFFSLVCLLQTVRLDAGVYCLFVIVRWGKSIISVLRCIFMAWEVLESWLGEHRPTLWSQTLMRLEPLRLNHVHLQN